MDETRGPRTDEEPDAAAPVDPDWQPFASRRRLRSRRPGPTRTGTPGDLAAADDGLVHDGPADGDDAADR